MRVNVISLNVSIWFRESSFGLIFGKTTIAEKRRFLNSFAANMADLFPSEWRMKCYERKSIKLIIIGNDIVKPCDLKAIFSSSEILEYFLVLEIEIILQTKSCEIGWSQAASIRTWWFHWVDAFLVPATRIVVDTDLVERLLNVHESGTFVGLRVPALSHQCIQDQGSVLGTN